MAFLSSPRIDALNRLITVAVPIAIFLISPTAFAILYVLPIVLWATLWVIDIVGQLVFGTETIRDSTLGTFLLLPYSSLLYAATGEEDYLRWY